MDSIYDDLQEKYTKETCIYAGATNVCRMYIVEMSRRQRTEFSVTEV